jgi:hypothetical protein
MPNFPVVLNISPLFGFKNTFAATIKTFLRKIAYNFETYILFGNLFGLQPCRGPTKFIKHGVTPNTPGLETGSRIFGTMISA